jgi:aryl-alcohol dehydrogenase-like predicted oxidoreductase
MLKDFRPDQQRAEHVVAAVKNVSDQAGRSMAQVALAWLRYRAVPVIPILGARKLTQLQDNLASFDLAFSPEQVKILDDASRIDLGFPQDLYAKKFPRALRYGGMRDQIAA